MHAISHHIRRITHENPPCKRNVAHPRSVQHADRVRHLLEAARSEWALGAYDHSRLGQAAHRTGQLDHQRQLQTHLRFARTGFAADFRDATDRDAVVRESIERCAAECDAR